MDSRTLHILQSLAIGALASSCVVVQRPPLQSEAQQRARAFETRAGMCGVYVFRVEEQHGTEYTDLFVDERFVGMSSGRTFQLEWIAPGEHTLVTRAQHESRLTVDARAGELVFVRESMQAQPGSAHAEPKLELVEALDGRQGVRECAFVERAR